VNAAQVARWYTSQDYILALPMLLLTLFALGILVIDLLLPREWKKLNAVTAMIGLVFAAVAVYVKIYRPWHGGAITGEMSSAPTGFIQSVVMDPFAIFFFFLFLAAAAIAILMSVRYMEIEREHDGSYYALILFSVVGMMCLAAGTDIVLLFIGLELMSVSTYVLVGFLRSDKRSNEAALKYLLLGAFSSGIFAYGLSLLYGLSSRPDLPQGSTNLSEIAVSLRHYLVADPTNPLVLLALVTTAAGLFFKIAAIPFHQWAPDAYEGAPTTITGFMSVAVKAAAWALLLRIFLVGFGAPEMRELYLPMVVFVAVATMTGGNLAAISQSNLKRLLAYSSIAHVGYMLLGLVAGNATGIKGILLYLLVYTFMNLGAFAVITSLRRRQIIGDEMDDIRGLWFKAPTSALLMFVFLLSLAGIPPLAGFYGKYFIFLALLETGHFVLAAIAVLYIAVAVYYYFRIANAMFMQPALDAEPVTLSPGLATALAITGVFTVGMGLFPDMWIRAVNWSVQMAGGASSVATILR
jgi:NADH-quinone oxidoreductase subunit N